MWSILSTERRNSCTREPMSTRLSQNKSHLLHEALSWSIFFSWSRSSERGWSRTVKVHPSFRNWSSSWFCGSLRGFCSGPTDFCMHRSHSSFGVSKYSQRGSSRQHRQAVPSCSSLSLWSAGIRRTGTGRHRSALCSLGGDQHKQQRETLPNLQIAELVKCVTVTLPSCTCEHKFPLVQQTPVRN